MFSQQQCAYCRVPKGSGERWVREKIYDSTPSGNGPSYFRYHSEVFVAEGSSCWEKHQMELESVFTTPRAA